MKRTHAILAALVGVATVAACSPDGASQDDDAVTLERSQQALSVNWGLLANPNWDGQRMRGIYFFSGEGGCRATAEEPATVDSAGTGAQAQDPVIPDDNLWPCQAGGAINSGAYTYAPTDWRDLRWSASTDNQVWAVEQMKSTHANVIVMSRWGADIFSAPMQTTVESNDELFNAVDTAGNILILPALDTADSQQRDFRLSFPPAAYNPADPNTAPSLTGCLLAQEVRDLVERYIVNQPPGSTIPSRWAKMYDKDGLSRYAINWIHAASNTTTSATAFVRGLDDIAAEMDALYGVKVGFTIDPFTHIGSGGLSPRPDNTTLQNAFLSSTAGKSFLGIQSFIPEVTRAGDYQKTAYPNPWATVWAQPPADGNGHLSKAIFWKRNWLRQWAAGGIPVIADISSGYDGRYVFFGKAGVRYGDTAIGAQDPWRNAMSALKSTAIKGMVYNAWNAYTEGLVATPGQWVKPQYSRSSDRAPDALKNWLTELYSVEPGTCDITFWSGFGSTKSRVSGNICTKWQGTRSAGLTPESGGLPSNGVLGAPTSNQFASTCASGTYRNQFENGIITTSAFGTHETHGAIYTKYYLKNSECGPLGLPITDEVAACSGNRRS